MALRQRKPTSPGRRFQTVSDFADITKTLPEKSLLDSKPKTGGRNNYGRKTSRKTNGAAADAGAACYLAMMRPRAVDSWKSPNISYVPAFNGPILMVAFDFPGTTFSRFNEWLSNSSAVES